MDAGDALCFALPLGQGGRRFPVDEAGDTLFFARELVLVAICCFPRLALLLVVLAAVAFPPGWFLLSKPPALTDVEALALALGSVYFQRAIRFDL